MHRARPFPLPALPPLSTALSQCLLRQALPFLLPLLTHPTPPSTNALHTSAPARSAPPAPPRLTPAEMMEQRRAARARKVDRREQRAAEANMLVGRRTAGALHTKIIRAAQQTKLHHQPQQLNGHPHTRPSASVEGGPTPPQGPTNIPNPPQPDPDPEEAARILGALTEGLASAVPQQWIPSTRPREEVELFTIDGPGEYEAFYAGAAGAGVGGEESGTLEPARLLIGTTAAPAPALPENDPPPPSAPYEQNSSLAQPYPAPPFILPLPPQYQAVSPDDQQDPEPAEDDQDLRDDIPAPGDSAPYGAPPSSVFVAPSNVAPPLSIPAVRAPPIDTPQPRLPRPAPVHPEQDYSTYPAHVAEHEAAAYDAALLEHLRDQMRFGHKDDIWLAYSELTASHPLGGRHVHPATLHRLADHFCRQRPRTRAGFLRLLSVLNDLRNAGGAVMAYQWNALADFAGKGFRAPTMADFEASLAVYRDMLLEWHAASARREERLAGEAGGAAPDVGAENARADTAKPDIVTYNTLLSVAAKTGSEKAMSRAIELLSPHYGGPSRLPVPDALTYLSLIPHYTAMGTPVQGAEILRSVIALGAPLTIDAFNAVMWSYARNRAVDVALEVYAALRAHALDPDTPWREQEQHQEESEGDGAPSSSSWATNPVLSLPGLEFAPALKPDAITYALLVQQLCHDGRMYAALRVFQEMVAPPAALAPSMPVFRGIFIGFARHAGDPRRLRSAGSLGLRLMTRRGVRAVTGRMTDVLGHALGMEDADDDARAERAAVWSLAALERLFASFVALQWDEVPSGAVLYWILMGYAKASGNDWARLLEVWEALEERFGALDGWRWSPPRAGDRLERVLRTIRQGVEEQEQVRVQREREGRWQDEQRRFARGAPYGDVAPRYGGPGRGEGDMF